MMGLAMAVLVTGKVLGLTENPHHVRVENTEPLELRCTRGLKVLNGAAAKL